MKSCINCKYCDINHVIYSIKNEGFVKFKCKFKDTLMSETPWINTNSDESVLCVNYVENELDFE